MLNMINYVCVYTHTNARVSHACVCSRTRETHACVRLTHSLSHTLTHTQG